MMSLRQPIGFVSGLRTLQQIPMGVYSIHSGIVLADLPEGKTPANGGTIGEIGSGMRSTVRFQRRRRARGPVRRSRRVGGAVLPAPLRRGQGSPDTKLSTIN